MNNIPPLKHITLILTYACQLRCKMCGQVNLPEESPMHTPCEMDAGLAIQRLDELASLKTCYLFGGEPLLYKNLFMIVDYLSSRSILSEFSTNGLLLSKNAQRIVDKNVGVLSVSLDSHRSEIHDEIRGLPGLFEQACVGIQTLLKIRNKSGRKHPLVKIHFTLLPENRNEMLDYYNYFTNRFPELNKIKFHFPRFVTRTMAHEYSNVLNREFGIEPTSHLGNFLNDSVCGQMDFDHIHAQVSELLKRPKTSVTGPVDLPGIRHYFQSPATPPPKSRCACFKSLAIQPDGSAVNCADFPDIVYGNIKDQSLSEIWAGKVAKQWRSYLEAHGNPGALSRCSRLYPSMNAAME